MEGAPKSLEKKEEIKYQEVASEMIKMSEEDQQMRHGIKEGKEWDFSIDVRNTERMKIIIEEIGWPTISKVGKEASHVAWLLVQHADHDLEFQKRCLELMKSESFEEIQQKEIGYLEDRVRVKDEIHQLYGTQFYLNKEGVFGPYPIEDPEHLDERRQALKMGSFEEYEKGMYEINKDYVKGKKNRDSREKS